MRCAPTLAFAFALLLFATPAHAGRGYRNRDGLWTRRPHHYKRHPNAGTHPSATCRDGALSFSRHPSGTCSHHGGVDHTSASLPSAL